MSTGDDRAAAASAELAFGVHANFDASWFDAERSLSRIETLDPVVHAFVAEPDRRFRVREELARASAGPLQGVLVGVKDIIRVAGLETRAGSGLPVETFIGQQAAVIDRIHALGAVVAGKTVTAEFALSDPGPTRNPRNLEHSPGGSSSGSAAAVAAGMVPLALGTQTVGSVIRPAAFCGVVGFRPTHGVLPLEGVITNARSLDTVGLFTLDAQSAAAAANVLCEWLPLPVPKRLPVLAVPDSAYLASADGEARQLFDVQLRRLEEAGYELRRVTLVSDPAGLRENLRVFQRFELARAHREWFAAHGPQYRSASAAAVREGQMVTEAEYQASASWRARFTEEIEATMMDQGIDAWVTPAAPGAAPKGLASTGSAAMSAPFSFAGMPAISLPTNDGDLPHGVQVATTREDDRFLLSIAPHLESTLSPTRTAAWPTP